MCIVCTMTHGIKIIENADVEKTVLNTQIVVYVYRLNSGNFSQLCIVLRFKTLEAYSLCNLKTKIPYTYIFLIFIGDIKFFLATIDEITITLCLILIKFMFSMKVHYLTLFQFEILQRRLHSLCII